MQRRWKRGGWLDLLHSPILPPSVTARQTVVRLLTAPDYTADPENKNSGNKSQNLGTCKNQWRWLWLSETSVGCDAICGLQPGPASRPSHWQGRSTYSMLPMSYGSLLKSHTHAYVIYNNNFRLFSQLTIGNCYTTSCHAGQHRLARRPEQQGLTRANAATNGTK